MRKGTIWLQAGKPAFINLLRCSIERIIAGGTSVSTSFCALHHFVQFPEEQAPAVMPRNFPRGNRWNSRPSPSLKAHR
jgi:hypothetical protein